MKTAQPIKTRHKTVLRYIGSKSRVADFLVSKFPRKISEYREPFLGGASVFLAARDNEVAQTYWVNDLFPHLYWFWKTIQKRRSEMQEVIQQMHDDCNKDPDALRALFHEARSTKKLSGFEAACFFFVLNRISFSGATLSGGFSLSAAQDRFTQSVINKLTGLEEPFRDVRITNWDYHHLLSGTEKDVFLFLDPPYPNASKLYGHKGGMHALDHDELAYELQYTPHKFLMTYCDTEEARAAYKWANISELELPYSAARIEADGKREKGKEIIIRNY